MAVSMELVKTLRNRTLVGFADCKKALEEADGDLDMALEILRKRGIAKAAKRADNETSEGKIIIDQGDNTAYVVSVSCETDFVARNDVFDEMCRKFLEIRKNAQSDEQAMTEAEALKTEYVLKIGENIQINALTAITGDTVAYYVHSNNKVAAVVVGTADADIEALGPVAMHITATAPEVLKPEDIPESMVEKEREIALAQLQEDPKNANKPTEILEKIIEGKIRKFREENALLTQQFVVDPEKTVGQVVGDAVMSFQRFFI